MRTTVTLDDDVVEKLREIQQVLGLGMKEAINQLMRQGYTQFKAPKKKRFQIKPYNFGIEHDLSDIPAVLEKIEGSNWR